MFISAGGIDKSVNDSFESGTNTKGSPQCSVLQTKGVCNRHEEDEGEQKDLDQQFVMHVSLPDVEYPSLYGFQDPITTYMEMLCNEKISIVSIFKVGYLDCKYDFKDYVSHATVWMSVTLHKVGIQLLAWLHWKFNFT